MYKFSFQLTERSSDALFSRKNKTKKTSSLLKEKIADQGIAILTNKHENVKVIVRKKYEGEEIKEDILKKNKKKKDDEEKRVSYSFSASA